MYPIAVDLKGKNCIVVGGGKIAERRIMGLLEQSARITLIAPEAEPGLQALVESKAIDWRRTVYQSETLHGAFLVIAATNDSAVNAAAARDAQARNILVCRTDEYADGNFTTPAVIRRGSLVFTVTTEGLSPTLAALLRERLEREYSASWEALTALIGALRPTVQQAGNAKARKQMISRIVEDDKILALLEQGRSREAEARAQCLLSSWE